MPTDNTTSIIDQQSLDFRYEESILSGEKFEYTFEEFTYSLDKSLFTPVPHGSIEYQSGIFETTSELVAALDYRFDIKNVEFGLPISFEYSPGKISLDYPIAVDVDVDQNVKKGESFTITTSKALDPDENPSVSLTSPSVEFSIDAFLNADIEGYLGVIYDAYGYDAGAINLLSDKQDDYINLNPPGDDGDINLIHFTNTELKVEESVNLFKYDSNTVLDEAKYDKDISTIDNLKLKVALDPSSINSTYKVDDFDENGFTDFKLEAKQSNPVIDLTLDVDDFFGDLIPGAPGYVLSYLDFKDNFKVSDDIKLGLDYTILGVDLIASINPILDLSVDITDIYEELEFEGETIANS